MKQRQGKEINFSVETDLVDLIYFHMTPNSSSHLYV
jgi:hypothetical protein